MLYDKKMASLKDKIIQEAEQKAKEETKKTVKEEKKEQGLGRIPASKLKGKKYGKQKK